MLVCILCDAEEHDDVHEKGLGGLGGERGRLPARLRTLETNARETSESNALCDCQSMAVLTAWSDSVTARAPASGSPRASNVCQNR